MKMTIRIDQFIIGPKATVPIRFLLKHGTRAEAVRCVRNPNPAASTDLNELLSDRQTRCGFATANN